VLWILYPKPWFWWSAMHRIKVIAAPCQHKIIQVVDSEPRTSPLATAWLNFIQITMYRPYHQMACASGITWVKAHSHTVQATDVSGSPEVQDISVWVSYINISIQVSTLCNFFKMEACFLEHGPSQHILLSAQAILHIQLRDFYSWSVSNIFRLGDNGVNCLMFRV
jgi:hypothetical protein